MARRIIRDYGGFGEEVSRFYMCCIVADLFQDKRRFLLNGPLSCRYCAKKKRMRAGARILKGEAVGYLDVTLPLVRVRVSVVEPSEA